MIQHWCTRPLFAHLAFFALNAQKLSALTFSENYTCHSAAYAQRDEMESGARSEFSASRARARSAFSSARATVVLPPSALEVLCRGGTQANGPMLFRISNPNVDLYTHCSVLEFVATEGEAVVPYWVRGYCRSMIDLCIIATPVAYAPVAC